MKKFVLLSVLLYSVTVLLAQPTISSFTPISAKGGQVVTISGSNFSTSASTSIVFFGTLKGAVISTSSTTITVVVPMAASYAPITVLNGTTGLAVESSTWFKPIFTPAKTTIGTSELAPRVDVDVNNASGAFHAAMGDMDGNGKPDMVFVEDDNSKISILPNVSTVGSISFGTKVSISVDVPRFVAIADMDGDGKPDIVSASAGLSPGIWVFLNTSTVSNISFSTGVFSSLTYRPIALQLGDMNFDGKPDVIVGQSSGFNDNNVAVFANLSTIGNISLNSPSTWNLVGNTAVTHTFTDLIAVDIDSDGYKDILATVFLADVDASALAILVNEGSTVLGFKPLMSLAVTDSAVSLAAGDVNNDNTLDIIIGNGRANSYQIWSNYSTPSFGIDLAQGAAVSTPRRNNKSCVADIDGDSKMDIITYCIGYELNPAISVVRNSTTNAGLITVSDTVNNFTCLSVATYLISGDVDSDGRPDMVTANMAFSSFSVFRNWGNTTWNGTSWTDGIPTAQLDAVINSSTAPSTFSARGLIINSSVALNTTGQVILVSGDIINNGNGISGNGSLQTMGTTSLYGNPIRMVGRLSLIGNLTTNGLLTVSPTGRITGNYANISGTVTLQQSIVGQRGWRVFSNPFTTAQTIATLATNNGISISNTASGASGLTDVRTYTNGTGWNNVTANTLAANTPYALFIRGLANEVTGLTYTGGPTAFTYNASGTLNGNTVTITPSATGFTLVGNPFAAPVNSSALTNGINKSYFVYQIARSGDGRARSGGWSAQLSSSATTPIPTLGVIAYQAGSASSYNISNTDINTNNAATSGLFRTQQSEQTQQAQQQNQSIENLALVVGQNGVLQDNLFIRHDEASTSKENDVKDLLKLTNDNVNFYTIAKATNQRLAVDARDIRKDTSAVPLGITAAQGEYTLKVSNNNIEKVTATLVDNYLQTRTELTQNTTYDFSITADSNSRGNHRFEVQFNNKLNTTSIPTTINNGFTAKVLGNTNTQNQLSIQVENAQKQVNITVMDVQGRILATKQGANGINRVQVNLSSGIHLVQVTDGNTIVTEKIMN